MKWKRTLSNELKLFFLFNSSIYLRLINRSSTPGVTSYLKVKRKGKDLSIT